MNVILNKGDKGRDIQGRVDDIDQVVELRRSNDKWTYILKGLAIIGWGCFFLASIVAYQNAQTGEIQSSIGLLLSDNVYILLWVSAFSSYLTLILAKYRARRKSDSKNFNMMMLLLVTFAWSSYLLTTL